MAITYPLDLPTSIGMESIQLRASSVTGITTSPFTFKQQVFSHPGQRWEASITIPPCKRDLAEPWVSFLLSLKGQAGTFYLNDPLCTTPQGSASTAPGTPLVNGANQTGSSLNIDGLPISETGYLLPGDYIQLGSGGGSRLFKVLTQVDTNVSGEATLDLWPDIRTAPADNSAVVVSSAKGLFRLGSSLQGWAINNINSYGISFEAMEVIP